MRRACVQALYHCAFRRALPRTAPSVSAHLVRPFYSGKKDGPKPPVAPPPVDDGDDEFEDEMSFNVAVEEEEVPEVSIDTPISDEDVTPEMAEELVERMVAAASTTASSSGSAYGIGGVITRHTISVLRAARFTTNEVFSPGADPDSYPINRKVAATLDVEQLALSPPAREAMRGIAGSRDKGDHVVIGCARFRSSEENLTFAVATLEHLVRAAKEAVGERVDSTVLSDWSDVEKEVRKQYEDDAPIETLLKRRDRRDETFIASLPSTVAQ